MKITIPSTLLKNFLKNILQLNFTFYAKPELNGVLFSVFDDRIELEAKNEFLNFKKILKKNNTIKIVKTGSVLIKAKLFSEIISKIKDSEITLNNIEDNILLIDTKNFKYELNLLNKTEFEKNSFINPTKQQLSLDSNKFRHIINKVIFAGNERSTRKTLQGLNLLIKDNELKVFASDNTRIAFHKTNIKNFPQEINKIISIKILKEILKILNYDEVLNIYFQKNKFLIISENLDKKITMIIQANLIEGHFPDVQKMFPENFKYFLTVDKNELIQILEASTILNANRESTTNVIKLFFENKKLYIEFRELEIGYSKLKFQNFNFEGKFDFNISFNPKLLLDALKVIEIKQIKINFNNYNEPFIVFEEDQFKCLILPFAIY